MRTLPRQLAAQWWGALVFSFALTGILIFAATFLTARDEAELGTPLTVLTLFLLFFVEHVASFVLTIMWDGATEGMVLLIVVFVPVLLLGMCLLSQWHYAGWGNALVISSIHVVGKIGLAILVGVFFFGRLGLHGPSPASVWFEGENWSVRETAQLRIELPGELRSAKGQDLMRISYLSAETGLRRTGKNAAGSALVHDLNKVSFGRYSVKVWRMSDSHTNFDLEGCVGWLLETNGAQVTRSSLEKEVIPMNVSSLPGRHISISGEKDGTPFRWEGVVVASGRTGWIVEVAGTPSIVERRAVRIFGSISVVDPTRSPFSKD